MQVTELDVQGLKHEFKVVVPAAQLEDSLKAKLAEVAKTVRIPGFRPGKVPEKILRQKYGQSVLGEVIEDVVNTGTEKAIAEKNLRPALQPKVEVTSFGEGADLEFKVTVEVLPEFTPMDFTTIEIEREEASVPESEIDDALQTIASRNEGTEKVDRDAQSGDVVLIDFVGKRDGVAFPGGTAEGHKLKLGSGAFIPGFEDQLIGAKAGETRLINVTFPEQYGSEELAGQAATFDVTIHEVLQTVPAKVDDDLAKQVGAESLEQMKDYLRTQLNGDINGLARSRTKRRLLDILAEGHSFPVPETLVEHEFEAIWKRVEEDLKNDELDDEDKGKSEDELKAEYRTLSERRVRLGLLLAEIGRANNVTVTQDDVNQGLLAEARRYPGQEQMVFKYFRDNPQALDQIRAPIFEDKVVDFVLDKAKVTVKQVTLEELRASLTGGEAKAEEAEEAKPKKRAAKKKTAAEEK